MGSRTPLLATLTLTLALAASLDAADAKPSASHGATAAKAKAEASAKSKPSASAEASAAPSASASATSSAGPDPDAVLARLKSGNGAFVKGTSSHPHQDAARIQEVAKGQKPVVTVLSCSDSRVPVELLFDQGIGDVFTVRVAGNVADTDELGTIEYGVDHLGTPVLVVMGHTKCGAVTAVATGAEVHGHIPQLVDNISEAVTHTKEKNPNLEGKALVEPAIVENVYQSMADVISKSHLVRERLKAHQVKIVGALYHLDDGSVEWLGEHPDQDALIEKGDSIPEAHEHADKADEKGEKSEKGKHKKGAKGNKGKDSHAKPEGAQAAHGEHAEAGGAEAKPAAPAPVNPIAFAIVAAVGCLAGAVSMKLASRGSEG